MIASSLLLFFLSTDISNIVTRVLLGDTLAPYLFIGQTRITYSYLLKEEDQPMCNPCQTMFTIKRSHLIYWSCLYKKKILQRKLYERTI